MTDFSSFGLADPILKALAAEGYAHPTAIQERAIPPLMQSLDLMGLAQTGTGKTAAFALPLLHHLSERRAHAGARSCRALILCPTRELASQIADSFRAYGRFLGLSGALVYGGANMRKQIKTMERGVDILIATPGRLIDLVKQRAVRLDKVEHLVLDEADQMLDMGFIKPIRTIVAEIPEARQTMLFSATMPKEILGLANELLKDPVRVETAPVSSPVEKVDQSVIFVRQDAKNSVLLDLAARDEVTRAIIFVRTKHGADKVAQKLEDAGLSTDSVHGNKSQNARERALDQFRKGRTRLLVATDVAARGIDVDGVTHVFNFDLPDVPESYVHRIGRTARAGADGIAISFCAPHERDSLRGIEKLIKKSVARVEHELAKRPPEPRAPRVEGELEAVADGPSDAGFFAERGRRDERRPEHNRNGDDRRPQRAPARNADPRREGPFEGRFEPRKPARAFEGRPEGRGEGRGEGRSDWRPERAPAEGRGDARAHGRADRPGAGFRVGPKPTGERHGAATRSEGRPAGFKNGKPNRPKQGAPRAR